MIDNFETGIAGLRRIPSDYGTTSTSKSDRSVWERDNGLWSAALGFDWDEWDNPKSDTQAGPITAYAMAAIFEGGARWLSQNDAVKALMDLTGRKKTACYKALYLKGKFASNLLYDKKGRPFTWKG